MKIARQATLVLFISALILCSLLAPLDAPAIRQVDAGLKRALVSFATARALNGALSVIQGTEIAVQPGGIGATFTPGQLLAPVNELVKHFADLMLVASVAFGIQRVLISISGFWAISLLLAGAAVGWVSFHFRQRRPPAWLSKTLVILVMLRFAIPVVTLGSDMLSQEFLAADYAASQQVIDSATGQAATLNQPDPVVADGAGVLDKLKGWVPKLPDFKARFETMKQAAERATEHIVKLIVIFLLQTLVIPLLLLWGLWGIARAVFDRQSKPGPAASCASPSPGP